MLYRYTGRTPTKTTKRPPTTAEVHDAAGLDVEELASLTTQCGPSMSIYESFKTAVIRHGVLQFRLRDDQSTCIVMNDMDMKTRSFKVHYLYCPLVLLEEN